jgi:bifunctional UDP-N-acetylglucosamine pyrophosphorylase/glucosamine-1-phosphate N-acetyltransferase
VPKVLAEVLGKPSLIRVLEAVMSIPNMAKPLLILSDHNGQQKLICDAVKGLFDIEFRVETDPQGTGHAMLQVEDVLKDFEGTILVTEGVQAAMRTGTLLKSLLIHEALEVSAYTLPTTRKERPYAYLVRDDAGMVVDSRETHMEQAKIIDYGEDNVSLYLVRSDCLYPALYLAKARNIDPRNGGYRGGALGFPNEMVRSLYQMGEIVTGLCMADPREAKSIKYGTDVEEVGRFILEMEEQGIH